MLLWVSVLTLLFLALPAQSVHYQDVPTDTATPATTQVVAASGTPQPATELDATQVITPTISIQYPTSGQALQGSIAISGSSMVENFSSAELLFAYEVDPSDTWFLIQSYNRPISSGTLALWDTTTITDGTYRLRLAVWLTDGSMIEQTISSLRVRNYTPIETDTPTPLASPSLTPLPGQAAETPIPSVTPTAPATLIAPTSTPLPTNPAIVTSADYLSNLTRGALIALVAFIMIGLYLGIQRLRR